ncbi:MAG: iron-containing alcohol dehydrogenase [Mariprofundus sp.]|nr:iron-containing alcohol dehydrogenase [Mariprofundus sp.]
MIHAFIFAATPHIHFGAGKRSQLSSIIRPYGHRVLLVTGGASFDNSPLCQALFDELKGQFDLHRISISGEPSPQQVDDTVAECSAAPPDCVVAIGGGSPVDAAKAIAGLLPSGDSVMEYLEGVGHGKTYSGPSTPFIALPTTAGTGGETSKNAVLSVIGKNGFKKSFRHEQLVARHIILDPELTLSCPAKVTAACGMDAFTQLLESYLSRHASPMTDALALSGMQKVARSLPAAIADGANLSARADMLYASSVSGLTLANAGLGSVHGLASPIGACFPIPHGEVCGSLLFEATRLNIEAMQSREPDNIGLFKYAEAGRIMSNDHSLGDEAARQQLLTLLEQWTTEFHMPLLSDYGITEDDIPVLIAHASSGSMKTNPVTLTDAETGELIQSRL